MYLNSFNMSTQAHHYHKDSSKLTSYWPFHPNPNLLESSQFHIFLGQDSKKDPPGEGMGGRSYYRIGSMGTGI